MFFNLMLHVANEKKIDQSYEKYRRFLGRNFESRKFIGKIELKIMADGVHGFFKIGLCVWPEKYSPSYNTIEDPEKGVTEPTRNKTLYSEGGSILSNSKLALFLNNPMYVRFFWWESNFSLKSVII